MSSLRAQLNGDSAAAAPAEDVRPVELKAEAKAEQQPATLRAAPAEEETPRAGLGTLAFAIVMSAFWTGAVSAYLWGYIGSQTTLHLDLQLIAFMAMLTFLPPFLFVAAALALSRAHTLSDTAKHLANVSDRLTTADESALASAQQLGRAVRRELDALSQGLDGAFGRMRALETALEQRVAQLEEAGARAGVKAENIAQRLSAERAGIEELTGRIDEASMRAAETLAGRAAQLKALMESAGGELRSAGHTLESQSAQFRDAAEKAAASPQAAAIELDRQARLIESAADAAVARAEFVLARQERQRAAMNELVTKLKDDSDKLDATLNAQYEAAARTATLLSAETGKLDTLANDGMRRLESAITSTAERSQQLSSGFTRDADRVRETADSAAGAIAKLVGSLRDAADSSQALIAESTADAKRRSKEFVGEAMAHCDQLLKAAAMVAEQAEKARAQLAKASDEAARQIASLPATAAEHAERARSVLTDAAAEANRQMSSVPVIAAHEAEKVRALIADAASQAARQIAAISGAAAEETEKTRAILAQASDEAKRVLASLPGAASEQAERARAVLAQAAEDATRQMSAFPSAVQEHSERASALLTKASEDAVRHMESLPAIAQKEAERVREALRSETERMLDISARTLATLQARGGRVPPPASPEEAAASPEMPTPEGSMGDSLRGMARRITAPKRGGADRSKNFELSAVLAAADAGAKTRASGAATDAGAKARASGAATFAALQAALADSAADLDALAGESGDPTLWKRYLDGDRGVFARKLASSIGPESVDRITALYRDNPRFHEAADNYLAEFEEMLTRAREGDRDGLLASSLLTADTGKIYLAVAYALGRLE